MVTKYEECEASVAGMQCDEYPYYASHRGGPPVMSAEKPWGSRIQMVPEEQNRAEGAAYGAFVNHSGCTHKIKGDREPFLVVVQPGTTDWVCH